MKVAKSTLIITWKGDNYSRVWRQGKGRIDWQIIDKDGNRHAVNDDRANELERKYLGTPRY